MRRPACFPYDRPKLVAAAVLTIALLATPSIAGETVSLGGFCAAQAEDETWQVALPGVLAARLGDLDVEHVDAPTAGNPNRMVLAFQDAQVRWQTGAFEEDLALRSAVVGQALTLEIHAWGTLADQDRLCLYTTPSREGVRDMDASAILGAVSRLLPHADRVRLTGVCLATCSFQASFPEELHPLHAAHDRQAILRYACIEYVPGADRDDAVTTAEDLEAKGIRSMALLGLSFPTGAEDEGKWRHLECRWIGDAPPVFVSAGTGRLEIGDVAVANRELEATGYGSLHTYEMPASAINNVIDLGLKDTLTGVRFETANGNHFETRLQDGFSLSLPGLDESVSFGDTRLTVALGADALGSTHRLHMETRIQNPGILFGPLGSSIHGAKPVAVTVEGKIIMVDFGESFRDVNPLGFTLTHPVVAVDLGDGSITFTGSIVPPDDLPLPLGDSVDVVCGISQDSIEIGRAHV